MAITAIICEYNPFHNGHAYHLAETRRVTGDDCVCLMSGPFVQRGEPAIRPTSARASDAVRGGADLVLTLPFVYACASARTFASGAVKMLNGISSVRRLSFGIERCDWDTIRRVSDLLYEEPPALSRTIRSRLDAGCSFPRAQAEAVGELTGLADNPLDYPNNTLAIEYLKALRLSSSKIEPLAIPRVGDGYRESEPHDGRYASATAIRNLIRCGQSAERYLPPHCSPAFADQTAVRRNFFLLLRAGLLSASPERIRETAECAEGLEYRILDAAARETEFECFWSSLKCKRYTRARILRILCAFLIGVRAEDVDNALRGAQLYRVPAFSDKTLLAALPSPVLAAIDADLDYRAAQIMRVERRAELQYDLLNDSPYVENEWFKTIRIERGPVCE